MNPEALRLQLVRIGTERARTRAHFSTLDRLRKQTHAHHKQACIAGGMTGVRADCAAFTHEEYTQACERAEQAEEAMILAQVQWDACMAEFDAWRTLEATKRAEMKL